jgi:hypothetical protein
VADDAADAADDDARAPITPRSLSQRQKQNKKQVAGVVGLICAGLYPTVVVPLQIAYAGREHPAQRRMREEAAAARAEQEQQQAGAAAAAATTDDDKTKPPKPQPGFGKKSMWASINQAAKSARS